MLVCEDGHAFIYVKKMLKYGKGLQVPNIIPTFACKNQDIVLR